MCRGAFGSYSSDIRLMRKIQGVVSARLCVSRWLCRCGHRLVKDGARFEGDEARDLTCGPLAATMQSPVECCGNLGGAGPRLST